MVLSEVRRGWALLLAPLLLAPLLLAAPAPVRAEAPSCKEACEAERKRVEARLKRCRAAAADLPRAQAARYRVKCRRQNAAPRCDGLPACPPKAKPRQHPPGLTLGPLVFSAVKRGPPVERPTYAPGAQLFVRVQVTFTSKPKQARLWLQLDLRLLARGVKGAKPRVVASWNKYLEKQKFLDPSERRVPLPYTLHGGAVLPPDFKAGHYVAEVTVQERTAGFTATASKPFRVTGSYRPTRKTGAKRAPTKRSAPGTQAPGTKAPGKKAPQKR